MISTRRIRRLHRLFGVLVGAQILLWTAGGIYFAWTDLDEIRGEHLRNEPEPVVFDADWVSPSRIDFASAWLDRPAVLRGLQVIDLGGRPHYRLQGEGADGMPVMLLADARTGAIRGPVRRDEAVALAQASFAPDAEVLDVEEVTEDDVGPHHEYRGRPLPAWRVRFAHDSRTHVYVSARGGEVVTHRNRGWRIFDWLWMLHTMDYWTRDDFNNPLLRTVSLLALTVTVTGYWMAWKTRRRQRPRPSTPPAS
jgi:hypothetical protein